MKWPQTIVVLLLLAGSGWRVLMAQALEPELLCHWHDSTLTPTSWLHSRYNEVWGVTLDGRAYAVVGSTMGIHFIDVTDAPQCVPLADAFVAGAAQGSNLVHRDFKHYQHYLYAVADEGSSTLQIIDMSALPAGTTVVYDEDEFVRTAHNLFIDTLTAKLYLCGGNSPTGGFSVRILSLADPSHPVMVASFPNSNFYLPYVHDLYVRNDTAFLNCGGSGLYVVDFTNPVEPVLLGIMNDYAGAGYNHSGWLSDDGHYYFLCDETHGSPLKVVDVSDLTDMHVVATMAAGSADSRIAHNALLRDDVLYVSYYYDGLQVWDVSDPLHPLHIAGYDTYPGPDGYSYKGAWGVFPLPDGKVLLSDMQSGLYVFEAVEKPDYSLSGPDSAHVCTGEDLVIVLEMGADWQLDQLEASVTGLSASGIAADTSSRQLVVHFDGQAMLPGSWALLIELWDGTHAAQWPVWVEVEAPPVAPTLLAPASGAGGVVSDPVDFAWAASSQAASYRLEVAFDTTGSASAWLWLGVTTDTALSVALSDWAMSGDTLWWRVWAENTCGLAASPFQWFVYGMPTGLGERSEPSGRVFPNPAAAHFSVYMPEGLEAVHLYDAAGVLVDRWQFDTAVRQWQTTVAHLPKGLYWLHLTDGLGRTHLTKLLVQ